MRPRHEPVEMGSPRSSNTDTGTFRVTEAWFNPRTVLEAHTHDRAILAVMLDGSFVTKIAGRDLDCSATTAWTEPSEERHANHVGSGGAHVLVVQPDPRRDDLLKPFARLLGEVSHVKDPGVALEARRVSCELSEPDSLSPVVMDSVILLALARSARLLAPRRSVERPPAWLERARELVHAHFREGLSLEKVAAAADVTPWHLAREFRRHFHSSIGEYARALRLAWALEQLARDESSISGIALAAGFADQSHFTRACRSATGLAPAAYRRRKKP